MKSFKLNGAGQFEFDGQNNIIMATDDDELMQCVQQIVTTNAGEWFLNPTIGWARFNTLGHKPNEERTINDLISAIMGGEPRVASVDNVSVAYDVPGRSARISYLVTKLDGEQIEGEATV